jgi:prolyl-tRNA editing enzyme YbaK/EbsC (Cys-tRNA(Pro) deacylase)
MSCLLDGGTPPVHWSSPQPITFVDEDLMGHEVVWAGAGAPNAVFPIAPGDLVRLSGGVVAAFADRS